MPSTPAQLLRDADMLLQELSIICTAACARRGTNALRTATKRKVSPVWSSPASLRDKLSVLKQQTSNHLPVRAA
uniref:Uncharacterized protein n=1 Tax=Peronospora matthiolae TaxID=2874970 RepID=A0AAV1TA50_9STRA